MSHITQQLETTGAANSAAVNTHTDQISNEANTTVVGIQPWLPKPLSNMATWKKPIRAEILASLRIGVAATLLLDMFMTMLPGFAVLYGTDSTGDPWFYSWMFERPQLHWSVLESIGDLGALTLAFWVWVMATASLLLGYNTRLSAVIVWVLSISFVNINMYAINAGDHIRGMLLFYLMLSPCGAAWSIDSFLKRKLQKTSNVNVHISPWVIRLLLVQLAFMYCSSGLCKFSGENWRAGNSLYYVLNDLSLARISTSQFVPPFWVLKLSTWFVLAWEITFPLLILFRRTYVPALLVGVSMHLGILLTMEIGAFPLYVLAAYVPLLIEAYDKRETPMREKLNRYRLRPGPIVG